MRQPPNRIFLETFIEAERDSLSQILRHYVQRSRLAVGPAATNLADELFNEVVVEALKSVDRLTSDMHPRPWLLGIAANLIKRKQVERAKRDRREPLVRDLYPQLEDALSDEELFDQLPFLNESSLAELEVNEEVNTLLEGLSKSDREVLQLAILDDMNGESLAKKLGVSAVAARVRLFRALNRLRAIHRARQEAGDA